MHHKTEASHQAIAICTRHIPLPSQICGTNLRTVRPPQIPSCSMFQYNNVHLEQFNQGGMLHHLATPPPIQCLKNLSKSLATSKVYMHHGYNNLHSMNLLPGGCSQ